jgi:hypothetical protein
MGAVFEVFDREQETACALKLLPRVTPNALLRFKHEFRALQGLRHPNLISLGELLREGEHWFFTMELVRGVDFLSYVRGPANGPGVTPAASCTVTLADDPPLAARPNERYPHQSFDEPRLRAALAQLAEGLRFLHDSGKVHCDIKPSNVLVTKSGRVVILDFGLVAEPGAPTLASAGARVVALGTPGYMPPERVLGAAIDPSADAYAIGVMLFRALTGEYPFPDGSIADMLARRNVAPPRPSEHAPDVPAWLDDLCVQLLDPNPDARPSPTEILARLGALPTDRAPLEDTSEFVGRQQERALAERIFAESARRAALVAFEGPSGIGKTALLDQFLADRAAGHGAQGPRSVVLRGRCYEHEAIPYKAVDGVIDALAEYLSRAPFDFQLPPDAPLLAVLFPVLERVCGFWNGKGNANDSAAVPANADPSDRAYAMRRAAERAARALLSRISARGPLVIAIDDFQWADADSIAFLAALRQPPEAPPFLLLLASRNEVSAKLGPDITRIALTALPIDDACLLAERVLAGDSDLSPRALAEEAGGNPFFIHELGRRSRAHARGTTRLDDVRAERLSTLHPDARAALELVALAGAPITQRIVADAAALSLASISHALHDLRAERLVRTTGPRPSDDVETYHDRIREALVARLPSPVRAARHRALALALERAAPDDLESLVTHFEAGGDTPKAAHYAARAGDRAAQALAFERAAAFYERALAHSSPSVRGDGGADKLRLKHADALANAGLAAEAAVAYRLAASEADAEHALEMRSRAADQLLRCGRLDEGLGALRAVLDEVGVRTPNSPTTSFASLLFHRARIRVRGLAYREPTGSAPIARADLVRVDALWAAAARLGAIDTIRAADFQARHLLLSLQLGDPFRVARALLAEAVFVSTAGPAHAPRARELVDQARALVTRLDHPYTTAFLEFVQGLAAYEFGHYHDAFTRLDQAAHLYATTCTGARHDAAVAQRFALDCLYNLGDLATICQRVPALLEDAQRRGDLYLAAELQTGLPNVIHLCADDPVAARRATDEGIAQWSQRSFYLQHYYHALASAHIALYVGDGVEAHRIVEEAWRGLQRSLLLQLQAVSTEARYLRARAAIAEGSPRALALAENIARSLEKGLVPAEPGYAAAVRGGVAVRKGEVERAVLELDRADRVLSACGVTMVAAACRVQRARLRGDWNGAEDAETFMRERGVAKPARFAGMVVVIGGGPTRSPARASIDERTLGRGKGSANDGRSRPGDGPSDRWG